MQPLFDLWGESKTILLPRVVGEDLHLHPYAGREAMQKEALGIQVPTTPRWYDISAIDLALIPGLAFDAAGHRLGRGKGYYDRLLVHPHFKNIPLLGVVYRFQQLDAVPNEIHDQRVSDVIWV